jgi:hypothetical protein
VAFFLSRIHAGARISLARRLKGGRDGRLSCMRLAAGRGGDRHTGRWPWQLVLPVCARAVHTHALVASDYFGRTKAQQGRLIGRVSVTPSVTNPDRCGTDMQS